MAELQTHKRAMSVWERSCAPQRGQGAASYLVLWEEAEQKTGVCVTKGEHPRNRQLQGASLHPPTHEVKVVRERVIPAVPEPGRAGSRREQLHDLRRPVDVVAVGAAIGERDIRLPEKEATAEEGGGRE